MPKIEQIYAFIAEDKGENDEGVVATSIGGLMMPLVGADSDRMESLRPIAQAISQETGKEIKLVRFSTREELEVIGAVGETG